MHLNKTKSMKETLIISLMLAFFICFLQKLVVLSREFCIFTPDFCGLAPMCIVGRVRRSQQKTVHAEPCEAIPLQQGGHWVGENRSRDILKRRLQASCL